jgi:hypothetical protein
VGNKQVMPLYGCYYDWKLYFGNLVEKLVAKGTKITQYTLASRKHEMFRWL